MLCVDWVCAGTFDDHEWVSKRTIAEQEKEEVMSRDLDYESCIPCVVQWSMLWFSAPTRLNQTLEGEETNREIPRCGGHGDCIRDLYALWRFAHTANVHVDNGGCSFAQDTQELGCEQRNEGLGSGRETCAAARC